MNASTMEGGRRHCDHRSRHPTSAARAHAACRALDIVGPALAAAARCCRCSSLIALAIRLDSPGPVLFRQQRVGRGRREPFTVNKFRTMQHGADHDMHRDYMLA